MSETVSLMESSLQEDTIRKEGNTIVSLRFLHLKCFVSMLLVLLLFRDFSLNREIHSRSCYEVI